MSCIVVFTTVGSLADARRMARSLVESKLVACAQISEIETFYDWKEAVQNEKEYRLLLKTTAKCYAKVERAIKRMHSYELPAIHALAIQHIYQPYADWVEGQSRGDAA